MPEGKEKYRQAAKPLRTVSTDDDGPVVVALQPATPTENVQDAVLPIHQSVLTESVQDSDTPKQQERKTSTQQGSKKVSGKGVSEEGKKERPPGMVEGHDGIWRKKSGYAFDPALTDEMEHIIHELKHETGREAYVYELFEEGVREYILKKYNRYRRTPKT